MSGDPIKRFVLLILFQAWQDSATELVVTSSAGEGMRIRYRVDSNLYEMSPPPPQITADVVAEIMRLARFPDGAFPKEGNIDVEFPGVHFKWKIRMTSSDADIILTPIRD